MELDFTTKISLIIALFISYKVITAFRFRGRK